MKDKYISLKEYKKYYTKIPIDELKEHNTKFINDKIIEYKDYFDQMFRDIDPNVKLDEEQIKAVLVDEDYEMVIAGAGSGKTTTMSAKVKYLVEKRQIDPTQIIMISYTNEAIKELKTRINDEFKIPVNIYTFHKFCLDIIRKKEKVKILSDNEIIFKEYFKFNTFFYKKYLRTNNLKKYFKFLLTKKIFDDDIEICYKFLNLFRTEGYDSFDFLLVGKSSKKEKSFLNLVEDIYKYYNKYLKKYNLIDFDGMIIEATKTVKKEDVKYKYLIIDEYQDISNLRFKFVQKLVKVSDIKLIVVGDDFQSIYSFSGSDISLFLNFKKTFGYASILKITNTYRNSQELIDIVGKFVMKNKEQINKKLISNKHIDNPVVLVKYKNKIKQLENCIKIIIKEYGCNKNILLLGRYLNDIKFISKSEKFMICGNDIKYSLYPNLKITFLTIHASKGLGYDNVIVLNNEKGKYGFPTNVKNNKFLDMLSNEESYMYAEERRLFYVALTRTKNRVYLLYSNNNCSIFIKEILLQLKK